MRLGWRRILAWCIDWACILVWVAATAAVGIPLYLNGTITAVGMVAANLIGAFVMVVPVVLAAAFCESRTTSATPGKRALGLRLRTRSASAGPPRFRITLARNLIKIGLPWILGHAAVYAITADSSRAAAVPASVWALTAAAYLLPIVYIVSLFIGAGRTPYDRITGTQVDRSPRTAGSSPSGLDSTP